MKRTIGLLGPVIALLAFGVIYNPYFIPYFPKRGIWELITSPQTFFLLATGTILVIRKLSWREIGIERQNLSRNIFMGIGLGLVPAFLTVLLGSILLFADRVYPFLPRPLLGGPPVRIRFDQLTLFSLVIWAPLTEELFFRGILLRALRENFSARVSVILSAVIFMGGHSGLALGPLLLGLITAPLAFATGSVIPGIFFHAICNSYGPILVTFFPNLYRYLDIFFQ